MLKHILLFLSLFLSANLFAQSSAISGEAKLFYYNIDAELPSNDAYTLAAGGYLEYTSERLSSFNTNFRFYTSNPVGPNKYRQSTLLYQVPSGESINTLAVANIEYNTKTTKFILGRQRLFTPMANDDTTRIIPYAYSGVTLSSKLMSSLSLHAGYIKDIKPITEEAFQAVSPAGKITKGFYYLGTNIELQNSLKFQVYGYYAYKLYDALHAQVEKKIPLDKITLNLGLQYILTSSNSSSKNLVQNSNSGSDDVKLWAYKIDMNYDKLTLSHSLSKNEADGGIVRAYGGYTKVYTSSMYETAKSKGGPLGLNFTLKYDFLKNLNAEFIYLKTKYRDRTANDYLSLYGGVKYFYDEQSYIHFRFEDVDRAHTGTDAQYLRVIGTYVF